MLAAQIQKTCCTCKIPKSIHSFSKDKGRFDGRHPRCKDCVNAYSDANRDRIVAKQREYNELNKDKIALSHKNYAYKRFFYIRASNLQQRHEDSVASANDIARLWKSQRGRCSVTGRRLTRSNAQLDHVIAIVNGGSGKVDNLRWVHRDVNYAKRDLSEQAFLQLCREVVANLGKER